MGANKAGVFAIGELLIRRPINQFFQQQIIQSSLPVLCLSTPAISSKHTHLSLSLSLSLSPMFCNLALQKHNFLKKKKKKPKAIVKVSVRCIWGPIKDPRKPVKKRPIQLQLARFMAVRIKFDGICRGILAFCPYF